MKKSHIAWTLGAASVFSIAVYKTASNCFDGITKQSITEAINGISSRPSEPYSLPNCISSETLHPVYNAREDRIAHHPDAGHERPRADRHGQSSSVPVCAAN